jgi:hypothetical protein
MEIPGHAFREWFEANRGHKAPNLSPGSDAETLGGSIWVLEVSVLQHNVRGAVEWRHACCVTGTPSFRHRYDA